MAAPQVTASPSVTEVATAMRTAIVNGQLFPGQRLVESELIETFGSTRGAVRHALVLLEGEGLVERAFNRGARVRSVSIHQAIEVTEARAVLEGLCAAKAAIRATAQERKALTLLGSEMRAAADANDVIEYSAVTQQVHSRIQEYARHDTMRALLERLNYQSVRHHFSVALLPGRPKEGAREHLKIIKAVTSGAADDAELAMRNHLMSVIDALKQLAERQSNGAMV